MQKITHLVIGIAIGMLFALTNPESWYYFVIMGLIGAFLPDFLDYKLLGGINHRNIITHNFLSPILFGIIILGVIIGNIFLTFCGITAFESHQLLDMQNPSGVFFWNRKLHGSVRYDNISINLAYIIGGFVVCLILFPFL